MQNVAKAAENVFKVVNVVSKNVRLGNESIEAMRTMSHGKRHRRFEKFWYRMARAVRHISRIYPHGSWKRFITRCFGMP